MRIKVDINLLNSTIAEIKDYLRQDYCSLDADLDIVGLLELKDADNGYECYTEKFDSIGQAVEFVVKNIHDRVVVEYEDGGYRLTIYESYIE